MKTCKERRTDGGGNLVEIERQIGCERFAPTTARCLLGETYSWYGCPGSDYTGTYYYAALLEVQQGEASIVVRMVGKPCLLYAGFGGRVIAIPGWVAPNNAIRPEDGWVDVSLTDDDARWLNRLVAEWGHYPDGEDVPSAPPDGDFRFSNRRG